MNAATQNIANYVVAGGMSEVVTAWFPVIAFVLAVGLFGLVVLVIFGRL